MYNATKISKRKNSYENTSKCDCKKSSLFKATCEILMILLTWYILSKGYTTATCILGMIVIFSCLFNEIFE